MTILTPGLRPLRPRPIRGATDQRLLDRVADVQIDFVLLQRLVDLRGVEVLVAAELDRSNARPLLHDRANDDAVVTFRRFDADVIEQAGLPKVEKVLLNG